jgi:radical SAM protein with 4Fe4S-binding SPASM domain
MKKKHYWARLLRLFYHYRKKHSLLPYMPIRLWVELTSHCNYRCGMCPNKDLSKENKGFMSFDLFRKIIDEAAEFSFEINLAHRGESLMHSQAAEMTGYAVQNGLFTRLHTNGSLLNENLSRKLIQAGLNRISFSFDGFDKETYEKIRAGGDFDKTVAHIHRFLEIKKELDLRKPTVAIEVINLNQYSGMELKKKRNGFIRRFENLPLNEFIMKEPHNWAGRLEETKESRHYCVCPFPWNAMVIFWNGEVFPCPQDFFGDYSVGSVEQQTLREIWNGPRMISLRKKLASGDVDKISTCSQCDRLRRESFMGVPKEYLWKFIIKKMP